MLKAHAWSYGKILLPHDGAAKEVTSGQTYEQILIRHGFSCAIMPRTDDFAQVQSVRMLLPRCHFNASETQRGLSCLKSFHVKELRDRKDFSMKAVHDWASHGAKAFATLAYFASSLRHGAGRLPPPQAAEERLYGGRDGSALSWMT
jgi:phage terminase large subunit